MRLPHGLGEEGKGKMVNFLSIWHSSNSLIIHEEITIKILTVKQPFRPLALIFPLSPNTACTLVYPEIRKPHLVSLCSKGLIALLPPMSLRGGNKWPTRKGFIRGQRNCFWYKNSDFTVWLLCQLWWQWQRGCSTVGQWKFQNDRTWTH